MCIPYETVSLAVAMPEYRGVSDLVSISCMKPHLTRSMRCAKVVSLTSSPTVAMSAHHIFEVKYKRAYLDVLQCLFAHWLNFELEYVSSSVGSLKAVMALYLSSLSLRNSHVHSILNPNSISTAPSNRLQGIHGRPVKVAEQLCITDE